MKSKWNNWRKIDENKLNESVRLWLYHLRIPHAMNYGRKVLECNVFFNGNKWGFGDTKATGWETCPVK